MVAVRKPSTVTEGPGSQNSNPEEATSDLEFGEEGNKIFEFIQTGITLMTALAGIAITGAVIFAGFSTRRPVAIPRPQLRQGVG